MNRLLFGAVLLLAACSQSPTESDSQVRILLDGSRFSVGEPITATIENVSNEDVVFFHCDQHIALVLERRQGGSWTEALRLNGPICPSVVSSGALTLSPGEAQSEQFPAKFSGEFRIRAEFGKDILRIGYVAYSSRFWVE